MAGILGNGYLFGRLSDYDKAAPIRWHENEGTIFCLDRGDTSAPSEGKALQTCGLCYLGAAHTSALCQHKQAQAVELAGNTL